MRVEPVLLVYLHPVLGTQPLVSAQQLLISAKGAVESVFQIAEQIETARTEAHRLRKLRLAWQPKGLLEWLEWLFGCDELSCEIVRQEAIESGAWKRRDGALYNAICDVRHAARNYEVARPAWFPHDLWEAAKRIALERNV